MGSQSTTKQEVFHYENNRGYRKLDELGRITLPIELRRSLNLDVKDALEITIQDDCIILKKKQQNTDIFTVGGQKIWLNMKERKFLRHPFWRWQSWLV